jgi:hypothetical protein
MCLRRPRPSAKGDVVVENRLEVDAYSIELSAVFYQLANVEAARQLIESDCPHVERKHWLRLAE